MTRNPFQTLPAEPIEIDGRKFSSWLRPGPSCTGESAIALGVWPIFALIGTGQQLAISLGVAPVLALATPGWVRPSRRFTASCSPPL